MFQICYRIRPYIDSLTSYYNKLDQLLKGVFVCCCLLAVGGAVCSQTTVDTLSLDSFSTSHQYTNRKPAVTWRSAIIPGIMLGYGVAALKVEGLQDWNEAVQREAWIKSPHQQVHIDNYLQWAPSVGTLALGISGVKGRHNFADRLFILGIAELIQSSVVASIKKISGETRPNGEGKESFPSGHTSNAFTGAEFMRLEYKDRSPWYGILGYSLATTTGFLRMYNNKHWLSDVVAGAATGILSTDLTYYLYPKIKRLLFPKRTLHTIILPAHLSSGWGLSMIHQFQ